MQAGRARLPSRNRRPATEGGAAFGIEAASAIPRVAERLDASRAQAARHLDQACDGRAGLFLLLRAHLLLFALALLADGDACGTTLLDRIERPDVIGAALSRDAVLIAGQTLFQPRRIEIDAGAVGVDVFAAAFRQDPGGVFEAHGFGHGR